MYRFPLLVSGALLFLLAACGDSATESSPAETGTPDSELDVVEEDTGGAADADADAGEATDITVEDTASDADAELDDASSDGADADEDTVEDTSADAPIDIEEDVEPDTGLRCAGREPFTEGVEIRADGVLRADELVPCAPRVHRLTIPAGQSVEVSLSGLPRDARLFAYPARYYATDGRSEVGRPLASSESAGLDGRAEIRFTAEVSGEHAIVVERDDLESTDAYRLEAFCTEGCALRATRYPVLLVHGYAGVDTYFGVLDYFYDIRDPLRAVGYEVYTPVTNPVAWSQDRAVQLAEQLDEILRDTGARKVNIIAHSQGGIDARYLVAALGYEDRVASITTVGTPHRGIPIALTDFVSVQDFSPEYMEVFNLAYPDVEGVKYWSWSFRSCRLVQEECVENSDGEIVIPLLSATHALLSRSGDNDGVVPTDSMPWGEHLGLQFGDHFDEVGQLADGSSDDDPFDHRAFYSSEMRRLYNAGF